VETGIPGETGMAEPAPGGARPSLLVARGLVVECLARLPERFGEARAVPHDARRRLVGKVLVADEVAEANLRRIQAEPARRPIHEALDHEDRRRSSHAAIRAERRLVRRNPSRAATIGRHAVRARQEADGLHGLDGGGPRVDRVAADVRGDLGPEPDDSAVLVQAELGVDDFVPRVRGRQEILAAIADPFHRTPEPPGHDAGGDLLGIERGLGAEAAAHVGRDHADEVFGNVEQIGQDVADEAGALGRRA
jgi:hypothetical protein